VTGSDGSLWLALVAGGALLGGLFLETRLLLRWRLDGYFLVGLPLGQRLVPIPYAPDGSGRTASVRWERSAPNLIRFWSDPADRTALTGLHGAIRLGMGRGGVELELTWAPPWTPVFAALWLAAIGVARGEALLTCSLAVAIAAGVLFAYAQAARRAAVELRWAFLSRGPSEPAAPEDAL
jgi:hypothetical protein